MSKYCHSISKYGLVGLVSQNNEKPSQNNDFALYLEEQSHYFEKETLRK